VQAWHLFGAISLVTIVPNPVEFIVNNFVMEPDGVGDRLSGFRSGASSWLCRFLTARSLFC
jgi:hypothetical protein